MQETTRLIPMQDVERAATGHFFDADTVRFFSSRFTAYAVTGPGGCFFTYSNRDRSGFGALGKAHGGRRTYHVASFDFATGKTAPRMGFFHSGAQATAEARRLAEEATA